ncbi:MAG: methyltransferase [Methanobacteriaceae archaeon]|nr:methyltransferase [Methanobacteriaceae archaeon]
MKLGEFEIETDELVYVPSDDTFLLAENLDINYGDSVLEIGTGTGLVAMYASKLTDKVIATDINFNALELAEKNLKKNNINNVELIFGNLFEPLKNRKFDVIIFNTPYLPTCEEEVIDDELNFAFDGGPDGRKVIDQFLNQAKNYLNNEGKVQLIQSSLSNIDKTLEKLDKSGFISEIVASEKFFFEEIVLINGYLI